MCYAVGILLFFISYNNIILPALHFQRDNEKTFGWQHYFMLGLNSSTDGAWSAEDYFFTKSFSTNNERNEANIQEAKRRIEEMGFGGLIQHLCRKQLANYGDGTFAWNVEGNSFAGDPEWAHNRISDFIRSLIKPEGKNYKWFIGSKQLIWVIVLFFQLFVFVRLKGTRLYDRDGDVIFITLLMSIIGLTIFNLLLEARARYLFCSAPLLVILFGCGTRNAYRLFCYYFRRSYIAEG